MLVKVTYYAAAVVPTQDQLQIDGQIPQALLPPFCSRNKSKP